MKIRAFALVAVAAASLCPQVVSAQTVQALGLVGIREVGILIERLDKGAAGCGVDTQTLTTSLKFVLQQSRIKISDNPDDKPYLYLNLNILPDCTASVMLILFAGATIDHTQRHVTANVWQDGGLMTSYKHTARQRISNYVESLAKKFVVDWNFANPHE